MELLRMTSSLKMTLIGYAILLDLFVLITYSAFGIKMHTHSEQYVTDDRSGLE